MVETKKKAKRKSAQKAHWTEHRFAAGQLHMSKPAAIAGLLGGLLIGVGVYGMWVRSTELPSAPYLLALGLLLLVGALAFGDAEVAPVRVGDLGVGVERGKEFVRVGWCDIQKLYSQGDELVVQGAEQTLKISVVANPEGSAWVVAEALRRVPKAVDVKRELADKLPKPGANQGEVVPIKPVQVAGRRCAQSDQAIAFERDARICPNCGQVYHREHVPGSCVTCDRPLGDRAFALPVA